MDFDFPSSSAFGLPADKLELAELVEDFREKQIDESCPTSNAFTSISVELSAAAALRGSVA